MRGPDVLSGCVWKFEALVFRYCGILRVRTVEGMEMRGPRNLCVCGCGDMEWICFFLVISEEASAEGC